MAFSASQTVRVVVTLNAAGAKRELERQMGQASQAVAKKTGGGSGAGGRAVGTFAKRSIRAGRGSAGLGGRLLRSGLGRVAGRALGSVGIAGPARGILSGAVRAAGAGAAGLAVAGSVAVIGAGVKLYLEQNFPQFFEIVRKWPLISAAFEVSSVLKKNEARGAAFSQLAEAFTVLGAVPAGGFLALNEKLGKLAAADVEAQRNKEDFLRRQLAEMFKDKSFAEFVQMKLLGTSFGQFVNGIPDLREALLKSVGMR